MHQSSTIGISNLVTLSLWLFLLFACSVQCLFGTGGGYLTAAAQQEPSGLVSQCELTSGWFGLYACACVHLCIEAFCLSLGSIVAFCY